MVDAPVVAVRGEVIREVPPEIARFFVTVSARDKDRQTTLGRLTKRAEALRMLLDSYGAAVERRETGGVQVWPELKKGSGERVSAYAGSVTTTVTVADFTVLGELMLRLADQDQTTVQGPSWELRPDSPVYREARRAAIADALARAREYAEAVGARVTGLLEISDLGVSGGRPMRMSFAAEAGTMGAGAGPPELGLDPQPQTVPGMIEARFAISEPTGLAGPVD